MRARRVRVAFVARPRARAGSGTFVEGLERWLRQHALVAWDSLRKIVRSPWGSALTSAVIAVAVALPALLLVAVVNLERLGVDWQGVARLSVFLVHQQSNEQALSLAERLNANPDIASIEVYTREQALEEFRQMTVSPDLLDVLRDNPLPPVLLVEPAHPEDEANVSALAQDLEALAETEFVVVDQRWVQRLLALMDTARRLLGILTVLVGLGVVLVVGNTIRLLIQNRADEISVVRLVGGTDAFVRRPFLYTGAWYGLIGGVLAVLTVSLSVWWVDAAVQRLALLYDSRFALNGLGFDGALLMVSATVLMSLFGAWLAVTRHLRSGEVA